MGNRELLAVKVALEEWRHWLEGASQLFIVWTDHKNLEYIKKAKRLNSRQARWAIYGAGDPGVHKGMFSLRQKQDILWVPHGSLAATSYPLQTMVRHLNRLRHRASGISGQHHSPYCGGQVL